MPRAVQTSKRCRMSRLTGVSRNIARSPCRRNLGAALATSEGCDSFHCRFGRNCTGSADCCGPLRMRTPASILFSPSARKERPFQTQNLRVSPTRKKICQGGEGGGRGFYLDEFFFVLQSPVSLFAFGTVFLSGRLTGVSSTFLSFFTALRRGVGEINKCV